MQRPPVFFSSIPKCGKNIIYSFFAGLQYKRYNLIHTEYSVTSVYRPFSNDMCSQHYVGPRQPELINDAAIIAAYGLFSEEIRILPDNHVCHKHLYADAELLADLSARGIRPLFVYRDPRACLASAVHYAWKGLPEHIAGIFTGMSFEDAAITFLTGTPDLLPFDVWFDAYHGWLGIRDALCFRFEDLIGPQGGGSPERQREAFERILACMGIEYSATDFASALNHAFNVRAGTFHKGQIDSWRSSFTPRVEKEFEQRAGYLLDKWGYAG